MSDKRPTKEERKKKKEKGLEQTRETPDTNPKQSFEQDLETRESKKETSFEQDRETGKEVRIKKVREGPRNKEHNTIQITTTEKVERNSK